MVKEADIDLIEIPEDTPPIPEDFFTSCRRILNKLPKDPACRVVRIQRELSEIEGRVEKASTRLTEAKAKVKTLAEQCHNRIIDGIIEDPDKKYVDRPIEDEEALDKAESEVEDLGLILEALQTKRQQFEEELVKARGEVSKIEAKRLAEAIPSLHAQYNQSINMAFDASCKIKILRQAIFERDKSQLPSKINELAFQLPNILPSAEFDKANKLTLLQFTDLNAKDKQAVIDKLLK